MDQFKFEVPQYAIENAIAKAINEAIGSSFNNGSYNNSNRTKLQNLVDNAVNKAISTQEPLMVTLINEQVLKIIVSDQFKTSVSSAICSQASKKFAGSFDSVMIAAGKKAANDQLAINSLIESASSNSLPIIPLNLSPVEGDQLPQIGEIVQIHLASSDTWVDHEVVGYYVWGDLNNDEYLHRVFIRVREPIHGTINARMLRDIRRKTQSSIKQPSELDMHRMDYQACKEAGFESPGELLAAYKMLLSKLETVTSEYKLDPK